MKARRVAAIVATMTMAFVVPSRAGLAAEVSGSHRVRPGQRLWIASYDETAPNYDEAFALGVRPDGAGIFVTGQSVGVGTGNDYATVAYRATGRQLWVSRYNGPSNGDDIALALAVSPHSSMVVVTGRSDGTSSLDPDFATVAYDANTGGELWSSRYAGPTDTDVAQAVAFSPDGQTVFVSGESIGDAGDPDYVTIAYDAMMGTERWVNRLDEGSIDLPHALSVSPDGSAVFVTGESEVGQTSEDFLTAAIDAANGTLLWTAVYDGPGHYYDSAVATGVAPSGSDVYVTGRSYGQGDDYATIGYDAATGAEVWVSRYRGPGYVDIPEDLAVAPDGGRVYVTGLSGSPTQGDYATVAYDGVDGTQLWVARYRPAGADPSSDVVASPDGTSVFVQGNLWNGTSEDFVAISYDAAIGTQRWATHLGSPWNGFDDSTSAGISPDGHVLYLTGRTQDPSSDYGYLTVAFRT